MSGTFSLRQRLKAGGRVSAGQKSASHTEAIATVRMTRTWALVAALLCMLLIAVPAWAQERILSYHSEIRIEPDASMLVTETIRVRAEGKSIRRGIFREFPTRYRDRLGNAYRVDFEVLGLTRDGQVEPWAAFKRANGVRVDFGDDTFLSVPAEYEYALRYRTTRQLGYFETHDELYWNVTGNGWEFAIDSASATVTLPVTVAASNLAMEGYTGTTGAQDQDYSTELADSQGTIRSTAPLGVGEGLTLVLSWPKGLVHEPDGVERFGWLLADNVGLLLAVLALAGSALYLAWAWNRVGRDPTPGVVFPHYEPPADISPATARFVSGMRYDNKALTAALVDLAVKGHVHISQQGSKYVLHKRSSEQAPMPDEQALLAHLFKRGGIVELDKRNHAVIGAARSHHAVALSKSSIGTHFHTNFRYLIPSLLATALLFLLALLNNAMVPMAVVVFILTVLLHPLFGYLMKAPTPAGRKLLDKLEGFKLYLNVAEKEELNLRNPPQLTPELFERYLPYALALGVEQHWSERFARELAKLQGDQAKAWRPLWYTGHFNAGRIDSFASAVGKSFTSAISSAASPPGSGSGSGGGGSSGGGGGGGGGGGR
jgi:uncharacterized membrane protein YgcG